MTMEIDALNAGQPMRNSLDPCTSCADWQVLARQVNSLRAALLKVLDTREKEAKAHFAFQTASDNYSGGALREGRQHLAAMAAASNAEKEARLLLATLKTPTTETAGPAVGAPLEGGVGRLEPERVQLSRAKGWRMPENTVKVDRTTRYGNPFRDSEHDQHGEASIELANGMRQIVDDWWTAPVVVRLFEQWMTGALIQEPSFLEPRSLVDRKWLRPAPDLAPLRGKNLACWCKPGSACHADVLLRLANSEPPNAELSGPQRPARKDEE